MRFLKSTIVALSCALPLLTAPLTAQAAKLTAVLELFTSQGCSSCPPADAYLKELAQQEDVLALAFHVDYWDYLGWKDTLAIPQNTQFQRDYQKVFKSRSIYTPQMVINGRNHMVGSDRKSIQKEMAQQALENQNLVIDVEMAERNGLISINTVGQNIGAMEAVVEIVYFQPQSDVVVERGENAGRTLTYINAVTKVDMLGLWKGEAKSFDLPMSQMIANKAKNCAVVIRQIRKDGLPGAIIGAAVLHK